MDLEPFRVVLLRRLRMPLPLSVRCCSCGRILDPFGHHRAVCSTVGVLSRRGFAVENAVAQICREGGARVSTNIFVRDLDLEVAHVSTDGRRLEVVAEGLSLFGGSQLALDATLVSVLHGNGIHSRNTDKQTASLCEKHKERTYPELQGRNGRVRMVVIAGEVGGRWSKETKSFLLGSRLRKVPFRSKGPVKEREGCLVPQVVLLPRLCRGKGSCFVAPGASRSPGGWG